MTAAIVIGNGAALPLEPDFRRFVKPAVGPP